MKKNIFLLIFMVFMSLSYAQNVLIFSKTSGFRHASIETGVKAIEELCVENNFKAVHTEDAASFTTFYLVQFDLVIFLNTTGDVLNEIQQTNFEKFIQNGGSFMGIHSAADTEYDWPWYGKLVGAYFLSHPEQAQANIKVLSTDHESCSHLPSVWSRFDEWYNYKNISPDIHVLMELDETSYEGGTNGAHHPIAWYQEFDGGKMFYTGGGHTEASYSEPDFRKHLLGGMKYCLEK